MKLEINREDNTLYVRIGEEDIQTTQEVYPGVTLNLGEDGRVVGLEVLNLSQPVRKVRPADIRGKYADLAMPSDVHMREKHEEVEREEKLWGERHPATSITDGQQDE